MAGPPDVVVIGAGISGLATACLLAESGRRVAILEHHAVAGGLIQRFRRAGVPFDTGFHYMGGAGPGGPLRPYLERLGVLDRVELLPFDPDGFDEIVLPGRRVALPQAMDRIETRLVETFPGDADGVREYLRRIADLVLAHPSVVDGLPRTRPQGASSAGGVTLTVAETLDALVADPDLKAVLAAHGLIYGVPAVAAPMDAHAVVCGSYFHSVHGVRGGGTALAGALAERLRELGGELRLRTGVRTIVTDGGAVTGVVTEWGESIDSARVVSTAHPSVTLGLLGDAAVPPRHVRRIRALHDTPGAILVHAVARGAPPVALRRNHFVFERAEDAWCELRPWFRRGATPPCMAVLPGPPTREVPDSTVFQVLCPVRSDDFDAPADRGATADAASWTAHKLDAARRLIPLVERCIPAWAGRIDVVDVSTPRAIERFVRSPAGSCFGVASTSAQWTSPKFPTGFGVRGLTSAGQSVGLPGLYGAIASAFVAAAQVQATT